MSCCSELTSVSWSTICEGSMGLSGSCACSCAVKSVMNELGFSVLLEFAEEELEDEFSCVSAGGARWFTIGFGDVMLLAPLFRAEGQTLTLSLPLESKIPLMTVLALGASPVAGDPSPKSLGVAGAFVSRGARSSRCGFAPSWEAPPDESVLCSRR